MSNVRKRISELTALTSASLDTVIVGVDNGTTYKIELDVLADAVTSRVNILDRDRLSSLESVTSSFETKGRSVVSSSAQITALGFVSSSTDISSLNSFTSSQIILNTAFTNGINARITTSSFNEFSASVHSEILAATNEQSFNGLISGSSQLTASYDDRYILSGSITETTWDNIANKPDGIVSQSTDLSALNLFTQSADERIGNLEVVTSSYLTSLDGAISGAGQIADLGFVTGSYAYLTEFNSLTQSFNIISGSVVNITNAVDVTQLNNTTASLNDFTESVNLRLSNLESNTGSYLTSLNGTISGSSQLTASYDSRYAPSASYLTSLNGAFSSSIQTLGGSGVYSSSAQLPSGLISGSSQLTASYDTRYTLSGSVVSGTTPAGTISGSSQLTASFDGRYVQTGSFNTLTASFNSFTASAQAVTTGSNSFNGTQTITGSLIITSGSFVGSQLLANTSSLYLTSGSNMYVQNNGVVEITGSLNVSGSANFNVASLNINGRSGDEGGEINFAVPQTNTTLSTRVVADIYQNRFRIFDGNTNGVYIDLSKAPTGVNGEITWKSSGIVNAGTFVQLDNIKATIPASGNRALALATVSGTISGYISGHYQGISSSSAGITQTISLSTSTSTSIFGWNFGQQGDTSHYILRDDTNGRVYRFVVIIGGSYNNNFISIERLH